MPIFAAARVMTLDELFSGAIEFRLPAFQRAYAWNTAESGRLLTNLLEFLKDAPSSAGYALGTIFVAQEPGSAAMVIVDGHQRIMTLTLLYAIMRDLAADDTRKSALQRRIGTGEAYNFTPQPGIAEFIARYVQEPGATSLDFDEDLGELSQSELNVIENRDHMRFRLSGEFISEAQRQALVDLLDQRCWVYVHSVENLRQAWQMLRVEEETRLRHNSADAAKASLLGIMPKSDMPRCGELWDDCERLLGADDLNWLLHYIRSIATRKRNTAPVEMVLAEKYELQRKGLAFMEDVLVPGAQRLSMLRNCEVGTGNSRKAISRHLQYLSWIEPHQWVAPALHWIAMRGEGQRQTALFFEKLERLQWIMRLSSVDPNKQKDRMTSLLGEIDRGVSVESMKELDLSKTMIKGALTNLRSRTFFDKRFSGEVLRRLSAELGGAPGPIDGKNVTIEHVLPQSEPPAGRAWWKDFPTKKKIGDYAHRLGNLVLLTHHENSQLAGTNDWPVKRKVLAQSNFVLSQRAAEQDAWNAASIDARTEALIKILFGAWKIEI